MAESTTMIEAHAHLAYAPRGAGLLHGVLWSAVGPSNYGWYIGLRDGLPETNWPGTGSALICQTN